jgi:hypothetical protein
LRDSSERNGVEVGGLVLEDDGRPVSGRHGSVDLVESTGGDCILDILGSNSALVAQIVEIGFVLAGSHIFAPHLLLHIVNAHGLTGKALFGYLLVQP